MDTTPTGLRHAASTPVLARGTAGGGVREASEDGTDAPPMGVTPGVGLVGTGFDELEDVRLNATCTGFRSPKVWSSSKRNSHHTQSFSSLFFLYVFASLTLGELRRNTTLRKLRTQPAQHATLTTYNINYRRFLYFFTSHRRASRQTLQEFSDLKR